MECVICHAVTRWPEYGLTCSQKCHEELIRRFEEKCGKFKKIVRMATGEAFKVPTRDIVEHGVSKQDLDKYPRWEETIDGTRFRRG